MNVFRDMRFFMHSQRSVLQHIFQRNEIRGLSSDCKIGFVGLGNMGEKMCKNLLKKDYKVIVKDVNPRREEVLAKAGATTATSNTAVAEFSDIIITMLPASHHVTSFYVGETGIMKFIKPGTIAIDCSTVDYTTPKYLGNIFEENGAYIIDAPVSGGVIAASKGTLTFMVGGKEEIVKKAQPVLSEMGENIIYCGELGSGQIAKVCNNLLLAISMLGAVETFHLGRKLGIDLKVLSKVLNSSSGRCWVTDTYNPVPNILENVPSSKDYEPGFTSQMLLKDLQIAERAARHVNHHLNLGKITLEIYKKICETDLREKDFSIIYEYITNENYYDKLKD